MLDNNDFDFSDLDGGEEPIECGGLYFDYIENKTELITDGSEKILGGNKCYW